MICSRMAFGSVYCESLRGSFLGSLYLYRWYNHTTFFGMIMWGVLDCVVCLMHFGIVPITIVVFVRGW